MIKKWNIFLNESKGMDEILQDIKDILIEYEDNNVNIFNKESRIYIKSKNKSKKVLEEKSKSICDRLNSFGYKPYYKPSDVYTTIEPVGHEIIYISVIRIIDPMKKFTSESISSDMINTPLHQQYNEIKDILIEFDEKYTMDTLKGNGRYYPFIHIRVYYTLNKSQREYSPVSQSEIAKKMLSNISNEICDRLKRFDYHPYFNDFNISKRQQYDYYNDITVIIGTDKLNPLKESYEKYLSKFCNEIKDILIEFEDNEYKMEVFDTISNDDKKLVCIKIYSDSTDRDFARSMISESAKSICERLKEHGYNPIYNESDIKYIMNPETFTPYFFNYITVDNI
jgi:hypothetical protein